MAMQEDDAAKRMRAIVAMCSADSPPTLELLTQAHLLAVEVDIPDLDRWTIAELRGYDTIDGTPDYRVVEGAAVYSMDGKRWLPLVTPDAELTRTLSTLSLSQPLSQLAAAESPPTSTTITHFPHPASIAQTLREQSGVPILFTGIQLQAHQLAGVLRHIRIELATRLAALLRSRKSAPTATSRSNRELMPTPTTASQDIRIFISHSAADARLAEAFVQLLTESLVLHGRHVRCTSVEGHKLPVGADIATVLRDESTSVEWLVGLLTPNATKSSWVLFELGAAWGARRAIAPILAFGVSFADLPDVLKGSHAVAGNNQPGIHGLIEQLALSLKVDLHPTAKVSRAVANFANQCDAEARSATLRVKQKKAAAAASLGSAPEPELRNGAYWLADKGPYCSACYEDKKKRITLSQTTAPFTTFGTHECPVCKSHYTIR